MESRICRSVPSDPRPSSFPGPLIQVQVPAVRGHVMLRMSCGALAALTAPKVLGVSVLVTKPNTLSSTLGVPSCGRLYCRWRTPCRPPMFGKSSRPVLNPSPPPTRHHRQLVPWQLPVTSFSQIVECLLHRPGQRLVPDRLLELFQRFGTDWRLPYSKSSTSASRRSAIVQVPGGRRQIHAFQDAKRGHGHGHRCLQADCTPRSRNRRVFGSPCARRCRRSACPSRPCSKAPRNSVTYSA